MQSSKKFTDEEVLEHIGEQVYFFFDGLRFKGTLFGISDGKPRLYGVQVREFMDIRKVTEEDGSFVKTRRLPDRTDSWVEEVFVHKNRMITRSGYEKSKN